MAVQMEEQAVLVDELLDARLEQIEQRMAALEKRLRRILELLEGGRRDG